MDLTGNEVNSSAQATIASKDPWTNLSFYWGTKSLWQVSTGGSQAHAVVASQDERNSSGAQGKPKAELRQPVPTEKLLDWFFLLLENAFLWWQNFCSAFEVQG